MSPVFPTGVGVFLEIVKLVAVQAGLPHRRGGVSQIDIECLDRAKSSPQAWGCFR